ncbi:50S ribosomal protein L16 [Candidatus Woesearchaeota archaeon]|nr:50S ribosomal protein L16 [Candidatus Woesearchaeota archaeon]
MAKLRKANAYRRIERAYTRISKYRSKAFVRARPHMVIVKFDTGNTAKQLDTYNYMLNLVSTKSLQIRHNALESARVTSTRILENGIGKTQFHLKIKTFPHHILRENALASGAGADRTSQGMSAAFGKTISTAAQIRKGQTVICVGVDQKTHLPTAKKALQKAACKFPCTFKVAVNEQIQKVV